MTRPFKMNEYEALMAYDKIKGDLINAVGYGADYSRVAYEEFGEKMLAVQGEERVKFISDYSIALSEVLKPVYLKALRSSMRSTRSRAKKNLSDQKVTSMTIDTLLKDSINTLVKKMNGKPVKSKRVFQVDVVRMAVQDLMDKTFDDCDNNEDNNEDNNDA